jgi:hypothetical protein
MPQRGTIGSYNPTTGRVVLILEEGPYLPKSEVVTTLATTHDFFDITHLHMRSGYPEMGSSIVAYIKFGPNKPKRIGWWERAPRTYT